MTASITEWIQTCSATRDEGRERWYQCLMPNINFPSSPSSYYFNQYSSLSQTALKDFSGVTRAAVNRNFRNKRTVENHQSPEMTRNQDPGV